MCSSTLYIFMKTYVLPFLGLQIRTIHNIFRTLILCCSKDLGVKACLKNWWFYYSYTNSWCMFCMSTSYHTIVFQGFLTSRANGNLFLFPSLSFSLCVSVCVCLSLSLSAYISLFINSAYLILCALLIHLEKGTLNWENTATKSANWHICGAFSWLIVDVGRHRSWWMVSSPEQIILGSVGK